MMRRAVGADGGADIIRLKQTGHQFYMRREINLF